MSFIYDLLDTWNNGSTTFTAIKMNVTDTSSASGSSLLDLLVDSTSRFKVSKIGSLTLGGATVTTSSPVIDAAQTWNDGGVTFTGLKFNATNTASASASRLIDLQIGSTTRFHVTRGGQSTGYVIGSDAIGEIVNNNSIGLQLKWGTASITVNGNGLEVNTAGAAILSTRAAANLRFGAADAAAAVAQTLSVQSVVAGTTDIAGANLTITGSQGTGTGAGGSIIFQVAPAGSSGTAQNALETALTIESFNNDRVVKVHGTGTAGTPSLYWNSNLVFNNFGFKPGLPGVLEYCATNGVCAAFVGSNGLNNSPINGVIAEDGFAIGFSQEAYIRKDAADTLALRNSTTAQAFRVYNTFTDATTFERANIFWDSNVLKIGTEKGSVGGTARALEFQTDGTTRLTIAATTGNVTTTGSVTTEAPTGGTAAAWRLGTVASVTPTSPDRTIEVDIGGTIYYLSAKTTND